MRQARRPTWHKTAWIAGIIVLAAIIFAIFYRATSPIRQVRSEAESIAAKQAGVADPTAFYWDRQRESYLTVGGKQKDGQAVYVVIRQKTGKVTVLPTNTGISAAKAKAQATATFSPKKIVNVGLSKRGKKFVWDVGYQLKSGKLGYVTYAFSDGEQLQSIRGL
ncbi:cell wall elongation regulator TseB-like domain-containing protein [Lacticaseibacillus mingshuiensis]|uniref:DUF5590 domain-containing protein n=1 Tax=Lacticaseibacillus mingshuiensis TaxID=2799574 RepID=A0ABW4CFK4_9LACO|nr:DUF5590 domain-containing protein [Lacticaseibacillus mingshuiensis]